MRRTITLNGKSIIAIKSLDRKRESDINIMHNTNIASMNKNAKTKMLISPILQLLLLLIIHRTK